MISLLFKKSESEVIQNIVLNAVSRAYNSNIHQVRRSIHLSHAYDICLNHVLDKADKINGSNNINGWIFTVCLNKCRDMQKKTKPTMIPIYDLDVPSECDNSMADEKEEQFLILESSLEELKTLSKKVILLRYKYEMSHKDIANQTGLSLSSVGQTLHRAKKELTNIINLNQGQAA
jgi:RNA polymerase sigma factor (sigma-70 family)